MVKIALDESIVQNCAKVCFSEAFAHCNEFLDYGDGWELNDKMKKKIYKNKKNLLKGIEKLIGVEEVHLKNLIKECHFISLFFRSFVE
jgi:hypothetical protein